MRLRITRNILESAHPHLKLSSALTNSATQTSAVYNFVDFKRSINKIESTGLFIDLIQDLKNLDFFESYAQTISLQNSQLQELNIIAEKLNNKVADVIETLNQLIQPETGYTLSIRIPTPKSFIDIADTTKSLDLIFNQTLSHPSVDGNIQILNFDMGSYWIDILVNGGANVMNFVAALAWGGAVTYKKIQEGRLVREQVRELKITNDSRQDINKGLEESENATAHSEASAIANQYYNNSENEDIERIKFALKELAKLYNKGGEIHLSLEAPKELQEEFPKMTELTTINSKIKQIPESASEKTKP